MKKSLIAIAALAAVGAASAQSSVTLYGLADINYGQTKTTAGNTVNKYTGFNGSSQAGGLQGSRVGIKGSEDLGGGLKAVFNYEAGFSPVEGAKVGDGFNRRSVVGLEGGFGSVLLGRDYTPLFNLLAATSVDGLSSYETVNGPAFARATGVHYSGNFSGVGVQAFWGKATNKVTVGGVTTSDATLREGYGAGLSYANGPFMIGVAGHQFPVSAVTASKIAEYGIGGAYDFGAAKLYANYLDQKNKTADTKNQEFNLGVGVPFGAATVVAEYGRNRATAADGSKVSGNDWMLGANYAFSKRTDVYARVGRTATLKDVSKTENFAVGLRHKF